MAFNRAMAESRLPAKEVLDGVLIIFGGALLLTPGFITDIFGLALLIPPTRAIVRTFLKWAGISRLSWGPRAAVWGYGRMQKDRSAGEPRPANGGAPSVSRGTGRWPRTSAGRPPARGQATSRAPPTRCATRTRRRPRARGVLPRMSGGDGLRLLGRGVGLAGLGWTLGGSSAGLLAQGRRGAPAAAEIEADGETTLVLQAAGARVEANLRPRPGAILAERRRHRVRALRGVDSHETGAARSSARGT